MTKVNITGAICAVPMASLTDKNIHWKVHTFWCNNRHWRCPNSLDTPPLESYMEQHYISRETLAQKWAWKEHFRQGKLWLTNFLCLRDFTGCKVFRRALKCMLNFKCLSSSTGVNGTTYMLKIKCMLKCTAESDLKAVAFDSLSLEGGNEMYSNQQLQ